MGVERSEEGNLDYTECGIVKFLLCFEPGGM
jgi:hypothetical protein